MYQLAKILVSSNVNTTIDFGGVRIKTIPSTNTCDDCIFETSEKANDCKFRCACMAHLREDRESVVFANGQQDFKRKKTMQQGYDWVRENLTIIPEKTKTISIGCFIPSEFSEAYNKPQPK